MGFYTPRFSIRRMRHGVPCATCAIQEIPRSSLLPLLPRSWDRWMWYDMVIDMGCQMRYKSWDMKISEITDVTREKRTWYGFLMIFVVWQLIVLRGRILYVMLNGEYMWILYKWSMFPKVRGWSSRMPLSWCILGLPHRSHRPLVSQESDQFHLDDNLASAAPIRKHHVPHGVGGSRNRVASPRSCKSWCLVQFMRQLVHGWYKCQFQWGNYPAGNFIPA